MIKQEEDFKLLKIQACVLKVNIHCDGCKQKVKKLLQRMEGVYQVNIDAEQQKVTVSGCVDSATLIKKLERAGKHAEIWSQNQIQKNNFIGNNHNNKGQKRQQQHQGITKGLEALKKHKFPAAPFISDEDEDEGDDDGEFDEEDELRFLGSNANQLGLLNAKKGIGGANNISNVASYSKGTNKMVNNVGKKGNPNQNFGGLNQQALAAAAAAAAMKMHNNNGAQLGVGGNLNPGEGKMGTNDIAALMNLAGFHGGNSGNVAANPAVAFGGNPNNGLGRGLQVQSNNGYHQESFPNGGLGGGAYVTGQYPSTMSMNMHGYNHPAANRQPQMMYQRSPFVQPSTGYYYNYNLAPFPYPSSLQAYNYSDGAEHSAASASYMFSDENTSGCSIM